MKYFEGLKYQLAEDEVFETGLVGYGTETKFILLTDTGRMIVKEDYAWDGASGPTIDTKNTMRGALGHDALYQLIRQGYLPMHLRDVADNLLQKWCIEDSEWKWLAAIRFRGWHNAVKLFAKGAAEWSSERKILIAP
jgi:hypothetical protein